MKGRGEARRDRRIVSGIQLVEQSATMPPVHVGSGIPSTVVVPRVPFLHASDPFTHLSLGEETPRKRHRTSVVGSHPFTPRDRKEHRSVQPGR